MKLKSGSCSIFLFLICIVQAEAQYGFNIKKTLGESTHQIYSASYNSAGNYIATVGYDKNIIIWNSETGIIYRTLAGLQKRPLTVKFFPTNDFVASGGEDNIISIWDLKTANISYTFQVPKGIIKTLDISPDGRFLAAGGSDQTIRVWELSSKSLVFELKGHKNDVNVLKFSPDSKILASGGADKMLILWNMSNGSILKSKEAHTNWITDIDFSPDGNNIASCGYDNLIQIHTVPGLSAVRTLSGHKAWVQSIDFSPGGKYLLSGGRDQLIILWDVASGKILSQSEKQGQYVLSVDFNPLKQDFISSAFMSENLETWAISGLQENEWNKPSEIAATMKLPENKLPENKNVEVVKEAVNPSPNNSMIEVFSPTFIQGRMSYDKNTILIVGRISDPQGINTLLINKIIVKPSDGGVFQFNLSLTKGENQVSMVAINSKGIMNQQNLVINCTAENAAVGGEEIPEIIRGKYFALLIGINEYQHDEINDLDNPVKDAESLYNVLLSKYNFEKENIILLKNSTQAEIFSTLDNMGNKLTNNDNLLIFYAGHGYWDDKAKVGYWLPSDAARNSKLHWFSNSQLRDLLGGIASRHTLLIADACFSGAIFKSRAAFTEAPQGIQKLYEIPSRKAMTSGIFSQEVPDESMFIKYLVKKLDENQERYLPSEVLFSNLKPAVLGNSSNIPQYGVIQNVGDEGGDFIFIRK